MKNVKSIYISHQLDPDVIELINRYATVQQLKPSAAIRRFILRNLPQIIEAEMEKRVAEQIDAKELGIVPETNTSVNDSPEPTQSGLASQVKKGGSNAA